MPVRKRQYRSGAVVWQLDIALAGRKRIQRSFETKQEALAEEARLLGERREYGDRALAMTHAARLRYAEAEAKLERAGVTLLQAVDWALERAGTARRDATLEELKRDYILDREQRGRRERYVRQLGVSLGGFVALHPGLLAAAVSRDVVKAWLRGQGWAPATQRNYLGDLRGMFAWGLREGYVASNPCAGIHVDGRDTADEAEITAFGPEQIQRLFEVALHHRGPQFDRHAQAYREVFLFRPLLGYLAIATFGGVRPEEVKRSPLAELDLAQKIVVVTGARAKTRKRRVVDLSENACAWLRLWRELCPEMTMLVPKNFRKLWEALRETAGLKPQGWRPVKSRAPKEAVPPWPEDVLRHTFATMHYATHQNTALLQAQLGHSEKESTLFRRYRAVKLMDGRAVTRQLAAGFWEIYPPPTERLQLEPSRTGT